MKKVLFVATVAKAHISVFHLPFLKMFQEMGWETHVAARNDFGTEDVKLPYCDVYHDLPFERSPLKPANVKVYRQLKELVEREGFDIVHCHTPVGGVIARLACRRARKKQGTKVIYTAHGFHFYKGAPKANWLIYYTIERLCARYTDTLITINGEDFDLAKRKLKAKRVVYVPGVGIDLAKFGGYTVDKAAKRAELGVPAGATLLLSVGELNENKNHETAIRAVAGLDNVYYMIAGRGHLSEHLQGVIETLGLAERVKLLGYRNDVGELCCAADVFLFPSFREGLSLSVMEAMACGLPIVCSRIRGNTDLVDEQGGALFDPRMAADCRAALERVLSQDLAALGAHNLEKIKTFSLDHVIGIMRELYCAAEDRL